MINCFTKCVAKMKRNWYFNIWKENCQFEYFLYSCCNINLNWYGIFLQHTDIPTRTWRLTALCVRNCVNIWGVLIVLWHILKFMINIFGGDVKSVKHLLELSMYVLSYLILCYVLTTMEYHKIEVKIVYFLNGIYVFYCYG